MARPLRNQWRARTLVRRRHRTWVASMVLATLGWAVWWLAAALLRFAPDWAPSFFAVSLAGTLFAIPGLLLALFTLRGRQSWIVLALVPIFANGSLLALPSILKQLAPAAAAAVDTGTEETGETEGTGETGGDGETGAG